MEEDMFVLCLTSIIGNESYSREDLWEQLAYRSKIGQKDKPKYFLGGIVNKILMTEIVLTTIRKIIVAQMGDYLTTCF